MERMARSFWQIVEDNEMNRADLMAFRLCKVPFDWDQASYTGVGIESSKEFVAGLRSEIGLDTRKRLYPGILVPQVPRLQEREEETRSARFQGQTA
eukprot:3641202-Rhodomonas_salina.2